MCVSAGEIEKRVRYNGRKMKALYSNYFKGENDDIKWEWSTKICKDNGEEFRM